MKLISGQSDYQSNNLLIDNKYTPLSKHNSKLLDFIKQKNRFIIKNSFDIKETREFLASKEVAMRVIKLNDEIVEEDKRNEFDSYYKDIYSSNVNYNLDNITKRVGKKISTTNMKKKFSSNKEIFDMNMKKFKKELKTIKEGIYSNKEDKSKKKKNKKSKKTKDSENSNNSNIKEIENDYKIQIQKIEEENNKLKIEKEGLNKKMNDINKEKEDTCKQFDKISKEKEDAYKQLDIINKEKEEKNQKLEKLIKGDSSLFATKEGIIKPGIIVLYNDSDWEIYDKENTKLESKDTVSFISTLHGG